MLFFCGGSWMWRNEESYLGLCALWPWPFHWFRTCVHVCTCEKGLFLSGYYWDIISLGPCLFKRLSNFLLWWKSCNFIVYQSSLFKFFIQEVRKYKRYISGLCWFNIHRSIRTNENNKNSFVDVISYQFLFHVLVWCTKTGKCTFASVVKVQVNLFVTNDFLDDKYLNATCESALQHINIMVCLYRSKIRHLDNTIDFKNAISSALKKLNISGDFDTNELIMKSHPANILRNHLRQLEFRKW